MTMPRFTPRHQYDELSEFEAGEAAITDNFEPSLTSQHFAKDADLNEIVRRFGINDGSIPPAALDPSFYGDFSSVPDFREALEQTRLANERFAALPAEIRNRFQNDPVLLWDFVTDPQNFEEAIKLGLLKREPAPVPAPNPETTPPAGGVT